MRGKTKHSSEYQGIRSQDGKEGAKNNHGVEGVADKLSGRSRDAGQCKQWAWVTHKVVDDVGSTEGKLGDEKNGDWVAKESSEPAERYQCSTEPPSHDDGVVQWVTDGLVPIISHYC